MQVFRPAAHDLTGVERIAVLDFDAPLGGGQETREAVVSRLAENRSYTLVEPAVLEAAHSIRSPDGRIERTAAIAAARQIGVDAILEAEVAWYPAIKAGTGLRSALKTELTLVSTGEAIATANVSSDAAEAGETYPDAAARWADEVAADLVAQLAPHYIPVEVTLARQWWGEGKANVAAGNALARQGDWKGAEEKWEAAKNANPANHAALHNLALAAEARQNYREAFVLLDQALDQLPLKLYHQTRKGMEQRQTTFVAAAKQVDAIRAAALAHAQPSGHPPEVTTDNDESPMAAQ
jgi:tetratricopeptide (TPR) repeat protein